MEDKSVIIHVKKRRYYCTGCSHTFNEKLSFLGRYKRHTASLEQQAMISIAEHSFTATGKMVGMCTNRVLRLFDKREIEAPKVLPECIAIDEFKGDAGKEKFQTIIVDKKIREFWISYRISEMKPFKTTLGNGRQRIFKYSS